MKVLHIIPSLAKGGAERIVLDICNKLQERSDVTCVLITFHDQNAYEFLTKDLNWKVIPAFVIPALKSKNTVEVETLQQFIDEFSPDVIHSHLFESEIVLSQVQTDALRVVHFHDNMRQMKKWGMGAKFNKQAITDLYERKIVLGPLKMNRTIAIAISTSSFEYMDKNLPNSIEKKLLLNAVDTARFNSEVVTHEVKRIVMIGSLIPRKNQQLAIQVIHELNSRGIPVMLDLLGDGIQRKPLEHLISELNLNDQVIIHGNVDHPEDFLKEASIYLHTAISEPFGLVLVEAMAAGIPVVCTNGGGNSDLIVENENGFLVEERSADLLADKIEWLVKNENRRLEMGKNAQKFSAQFDISNYVESLMDIYKS